MCGENGISENYTHSQELVEKCIKWSKLTKIEHKVPDVGQCLKVSLLSR